MFKFINEHKVLVLGLLIHLTFFISAFWTSWYDYFFFGSSLHFCCQGLDFFQVPNGAYAFFNGGDLSGRLPPNIANYSIGYPSNQNVYHPLFTIIIGGFFILFNPKTSFYISMAIKLLINLLMVTYLFKSFDNNRHLDFALFLMLINFPQYSEIRIAQFQFLFNVFFFLFLINLYRKGNKIITAFFYFLTLLVKPISLLFIPALLLKKEAKILLYGISFFVLSLLPFILLGKGGYYIDNLSSQILSPIATNTIDILTLDAFLRYTLSLSTADTIFLKILVFFSILLLTLTRVSIFKIFLLLTLYFLFFYDLVYQYHWTILTPVFTIALLVLKEFQGKIQKFLLALVALPHIFFILRFLNVGVKVDPFLGPDPTFLGWQIVLLYVLIPPTLLTFLALRPDIKNIILSIRRL